MARLVRWLFWGSSAALLVWLAVGHAGSVQALRRLLGAEFQGGRFGLSLTGFGWSALLMTSAILIGLLVIVLARPKS